MSNNIQSQVSFLPYISLKNELIIDGFLFWDFHESKDTYLGGNREEKEHLERIFKQYVKHSKNEPIDSITVASFKHPNNFAPLKESQSKKLGDIVTILCFSSIVNNNSVNAFASDDFQLYTQNFRVGHYDIAPFSGSYIRRGAGGLKLEEVYFYTPFYINSGWAINYNEKLLRSLEDLLKDKNRKELCRLIVRSLEWVSFAHSNTEGFKYESRIIMMCVGFEILLGGFGKRRDFIRKIHRYINTPIPTNRRTRPHPPLMDGSGNELVSSPTDIEVWAYDFYGLRSNIVHGKEINKKDYYSRKKKLLFHQSIRVFLECLKKKLESENLYNYNMADRISYFTDFEDI